MFSLFCMFLFNSELLLSYKLIEPARISQNEFYKNLSVLNIAVTYFYMLCVRKTLTVIARRKVEYSGINFHSSLKSHIPPIVHFPFSFIHPFHSDPQPTLIQYCEIWSFIYCKIKTFYCSCVLGIALLNLGMLCFLCIVKH